MFNPDDDKDPIVKHYLKEALDEDLHKFRPYNGGPILRAISLVLFLIAIMSTSLLIIGIKDSVNTLPTVAIKYLGVVWIMLWLAVPANLLYSAARLDSEARRVHSMLVGLEQGFKLRNEE